LEESPEQFSYCHVTLCACQGLDVTVSFIFISNQLKYYQFSTMSNLLNVIILKMHGDFQMQLTVMILFYKNLYIFFQIEIMVWFILKFKVNLLYSKL